MRKRTYRAVLVKQVDVQQLVQGATERLILGCDAAKAAWYGAWMNEQGEVLQTIRWDLVADTAAVLTLVQQLRDAGRAVEVAVEPTGTYADALVAQMRRQGVDVYPEAPCRGTLGLPGSRPSGPLGARVTLLSASHDRRRIDVTASVTREVRVTAGLRLQKRELRGS